MLVIYLIPIVSSLAVAGMWSFKTALLILLIISTTYSAVNLIYDVWSYYRKRNLNLQN
jgi:hypothetical protein